MKMICYDNEKFFDRYSIIFPEMKDGNKVCGLGLSYYCNSPQGYSEWFTCDISVKLGKNIEFSELPEHIQKHVMYRIKE